jgi:4-hydroxybenzoyl-CoA thioesterase
MDFSATNRVRFADIDRAGIVYYPRFFHWFHCAFEDFFEDAVGRPYHKLIDEDKTGFPSVNISCQFHKPVDHGERLRIQVQVIKLGTASLTIRYRVYVQGDTELRAEATITTVCVNMDTFKSQPIPEGLRKFFQQHMADGSPSESSQTNDAGKQGA